MKQLHRAGIIAGIVLASALAALSACVGSDPDPGSSTSSSGNGSSSGGSSGGSSSGATSSSGGSSSGDPDSSVDAGPKFLTGKLDATFKNGQRSDVVITQPEGVFVDKKGRTYVFGGSNACVNGGSNADFAVARFLTNGDLDTSYGGGGRACFEIVANESDTAYGIAIDDQYRAVLVGANKALNPVIAAIRVTEAGQLDTNGFNSTGIVTIAGPGSGVANAVAIDGTGIYIAGSNAFNSASATQGFIARLSSAGAVESSFGGPGYKIDPDTRSFRAISVAGGFVYAAGSSTAMPARAHVVRYTATGMRDSTWGVQSAPSASAGNYDYFMSMDVDANGRVVASGIANGDAGIAIGGKGEGAVVARFTSAGPIDQAFNAAGANKGVYVTSAFNLWTLQRSAGVIEIRLPSSA